MISFRDVARNIERSAVNSAIRSTPLEATLSQGIIRVGSPQNLLAANHNLDAPLIASDGTVQILLRANTIPISDGLLAP
ncbi:hypothetical protein IAD21_00700 [Abditibacteriota bacterium]|nr:hypothetical protein IAD21_00700 [Abditibacteriota bacterium]